MKRLVTALTAISTAVLLSACGAPSMKTAAEPEKIPHSKAPEALHYSPNVHLLGKHSRPDQRTEGYSYLLMGDAVTQAPALAKTSCKALFSAQQLHHQPIVAHKQSTSVTYLQVTPSFDFYRVTARFKWAACNRLATLSDTHRDTALIQRLGLDQESGPYLVHIPRIYRKLGSLNGALAVNLANVSEEDIPGLIDSWKNLIHDQPEMGLQLSDRDKVLADLQPASAQQLEVTHITAPPTAPQMVLASH